MPIGNKTFDGYEGLLDNSFEAIYNIKQIAETMRDYWEEKNLDREDYKLGEIKIQLLNNKSESEILDLKINLDEIEEKIMNYLEKEIDNFINSLALLFKDSSLGINKMEIFLSGNSSKSKRLQIVFNEKISKLEKEIKEKISKAKDKTEIFHINLPLNKSGKVELNAKTGTAIGLLESKKTGKFKIIAKDEEVNNNEINFRYYVGFLKNKNLKVILNYKCGYNNWVRFMDTYEKESEIYYTTESNSIDGTMSSDDSLIFRKNIKIKKSYQDEDYSVYIRAVKPNKIEYCVSDNEKIKQNKYIEEPIEIELK